MPSVTMSCVGVDTAFTVRTPHFGRMYCTVYSTDQSIQYSTFPSLKGLLILSNSTSKVGSEYVVDCVPCAYSDTTNHIMLLGEHCKQCSPSAQVSALSLGTQNCIPNTKL